MPATVQANLVALGVGALYTAPKDTARPLDAAIVNDTITTPWTFVGATHQGVTMAYDQTIQEIRIEEMSVAVMRLKTETKFNISCALSEDSMATLALAYSSVLTTVAVGGASSGIAAGTELRLQDALAQLALCFRLLNSFGFPRVFYIPRVVQGANVSTPVRRVAEQRVFPVTFEATPVNTSDIYCKDYGATTPVIP